MIHTYSAFQDDKVELTAIQVQTDDPWDQTPATYHQLPRQEAFCFARILANITGRQVRLSFPPNEKVDCCRYNGSYIWPDQH